MPHLAAGPHHGDPEDEKAPKHPELPDFDTQSDDLAEGPALLVDISQKGLSSASRENMSPVRLAGDLAAVAAESVANQGETVRSNQSEGEAPDLQKGQAH